MESGASWSVLRKQAEPAMRNKLVSTAPAWPLLRFLPLDPCLRYPGCGLPPVSQINPLLPRLVLVSILPQKEKPH